MAALVEGHEAAAETSLASVLPPVPEQHMGITGFLVRKMYWRPSQADLKTGSKSGARWWTMGLA